MFKIFEFKEINQLYSNNTQQRYDHLIQQFEKKYLNKPQFIIRAPGRVNIIGEHIDYEGYGVLPAAIEKDCLIAVRKIEGELLFLSHVNDKLYPSCNIPVDPTKTFNFVDNYVKYFRAGYRAGIKDVQASKLTGLQLMIEGNIPVASGVSSSSALCVCSALVAIHSNGLNGKIPKEETIQRCIDGERQVGTASGGMDQSISIMGKQDFCLYIEFNPIKCTEVNLPKGCKFIIMNSLVQSAKLNTAVYRYNKRVCECRLALWVIATKMNLPLKSKRILKEIQDFTKLQLNTLGSLVDCFIDKVDYTVESIQDIVSEKVEQILQDIPLYKQVISSNKYFKLNEAAKHVFDEAYRVINFIDICKSQIGDFQKIKMLGKLMNESQESCKNLYDCSCPQIDEITLLARKNGAFGSRLTGAGWGGCTVSIVLESEANNFIKAIDQEYYSKKPEIQDKIKEIGFQNIVFESKPSEGACIINL